MIIKRTGGQQQHKGREHPTQPTFRNAGAILFVSVPATIMTSDWRGEARNTMPNLSISYRDAAACIISTAQQAKPNVMGHIEPLRAQFTSSSIFETTNSALFLPFDSKASKLSAAVQIRAYNGQRCARTGQQHGHTHANGHHSLNTSYYVSMITLVEILHTLLHRCRDVVVSWFVARRESGY